MHNFCIDLLKNHPKISQAEVYGKCMLLLNQTAYSGLRDLRHVAIAVKYPNLLLTLSKKISQLLKNGTHTVSAKI